MPTIKLTNNVVIDSNSLEMAPNVNNVLCGSTSSAWTATEDCWVYVATWGDYNVWKYVYINGVEVWTFYNGINYGGTSLGNMFFLRKGDRISFSGTHQYGNTRMNKAYGCK